jgi:hypothetical protein
MLRMGSKRGNAFYYRPPCGSRRCTLCVQDIIDRKMSALPLIGAYYATEILREERASLVAQLAYQRRKGNDAEHFCIPSGYDKVVVVSNCPIGDRISREDVEGLMEEARPEWGKMTASKGWQVPAPKIEHSDDFEDLGPVSSSLEWIEAHAERMGLRKVENDYMVMFETTPEQLEALKRIAGVGEQHARPDSRVEAPHPWKRRRRAS